MMRGGMIAYKAVRLDKTSHYDGKTKWAVGRIVRPDRISEGDDPCGHGIHCSPTLLAAVGYQKGPSLYCEVEPRGVLGQDDTKMRCRGGKVLRWLEQPEIDRLAGFRLWEANRPVNPLLVEARMDRKRQLALLKKWASVRASVRDSVRASVRASVWDSVWDSVRDSVGDSVWASVRASVWASVGASVWASVGASVGDSVWDSVRDSVGDSVRDSVGDSVRAYIGGLFPGIKAWKYAGKLGPNPWKPLLALWYAGYVPSFDGKTWRLHAGPKAEIVLEWTPARGK